jgi:hypothetical protein
MPLDPEEAFSWISMFSCAMLGIFLRAPETRKPIAYMFLLLGLAWLMGGGLFGFDATALAIGRIIMVLFCAFLLVFVILAGIALLTSLSECPGVAIAALLLWLGLRDRDKDE